MRLRWVSGSNTGMAVVVAIAALIFLLAGGPAQAEFGDIVMNQTSDAASIRPVVFPHWFHRIRYSCKSCHSDLGIKFQTGGNGVDMVKVMDGLYCGACHNGNIAWGVEQCDLCHTGKPGMATQTHEVTVLKPTVPARPAGAKK